MKTLHIRVEGRVQGVFFRDFTQQEAERLGVKGWVRNKVDGTVEAVIQGNPDVLAVMVSWFHKGSPYSSVSEVTASEIVAEKDFGTFSIRYD